MYVVTELSQPITIWFFIHIKNCIWFPVEVFNFNVGIWSVVILAWKCNSFLSQDLLTVHKNTAAQFLEKNYDRFFSDYRKLLKSDNYVTRRQSLKVCHFVKLRDVPFPNFVPVPFLSLSCGWAYIYVCQCQHISNEIMKYFWFIVVFRYIWTFPTKVKYCSINRKHTPMQCSFNTWYLC